MNCLLYDLLERRTLRHQKLSMKVLKLIRQQADFLGFPGTQMF
jgi:hypothetical protein